MRITLLTLISLFSFLSFGQDEKIPNSIQRSIPDLTRHLLKKKSGDRAKAEALYVWLTTNVMFDYDELSSENYFTGVNPSDVLKAKKAISNGFAELYKAMLDEAGIESETVSGYVHGVGWDPGELVLDIGHIWVALKIDGEWKLADPTWDAGYIGRLLYDRKPYKAKKYIIPLTAYKDDIKRLDKANDREETEIERQEKYDDQPKFKDEIGFVSDPTLDFFLVHPDTFLLDHLPENPIWQLRSDYISIESFAQQRDSLITIMGADNGKNLDFNQGIENFRSKDFLHQYLANGERGFAFNPYNPGIKAINYYNFMALVHNKQIQRYARGSLYEITEDKYPVLDAINDTIIKYSKLYKTFEKTLYKNRQAFDKEKYTITKTKDKDNSKLIRKIESENDKLALYIKSNNEKIEYNLEKLDGIKEGLEEKYPYVVNYNKPSSSLKKDLVKVWKDSLDMALKDIKAMNVTTQETRKKSSYVELLDDLNYLDYLLGANSNFIRFNSYSNNEIIAKVDSFITQSATHALMLYNDSLEQELLQKDVMDFVKTGKKYIIGAKADLRLAKQEGKITDTNPYETYLTATLMEIIKEAEEMHARSKFFNDQVLPLVKGNLAIRSINKLIEDQIELKEDKNDYIIEQVEKSHIRMEKLITQMREDAKEWRAIYH